MFSGCQDSDAHNVRPAAVKGVLDLSGWDMREDGLIKLDGEWAFYWQALYAPENFKKMRPDDSVRYVAIPKPWNGLKFDGNDIGGDGYATYRLKVKLSHTYDLYALKTQWQTTAYKLWVNGKLLSSVGEVGRSKTAVKPQYLPQVIPFQTEGETLDIVMQISNFHHKNGGFISSLELGVDDQLQLKRSELLLFDIFLVGALFIMGIYHLSLYALRKKELSTLYFGIFCFLMIIQAVTRGEQFLVLLFPAISWELLVTLEYAGMYLLVPVFLLYLNQLFGYEFSQKVLKIFLSLTLAFVLFVLITTPHVYTHTLLSYQMIILLASIYVIYVLIQALKNQRVGAKLFVLAFVFLFVTIINDLLFSNDIIQSNWYTPFGFFIFVFAQSFILSYRFSNAYKTIEKQTEVLSQTNLAYSRFVPKQFLNYLHKESILNVRLGDQIRMQMTILFADIRSFTKLSESMTPEENFNFLNAYLEQVGPNIKANNGFIDKYIGDAIMALFPGGPEDALNAAIGIQNSIRNVNKDKAILSSEMVKVGIGIHSGDLMLGIIGEGQRMEGTVISDAVNLASRLEGLTKRYGVSILISDTAFDFIKRVENYHFRYLDKVKVKGKERPVGVIEVLDGLDQQEFKEKLLTKEHFDKAYELYKQRAFRQAKLLFEKILEDNSNDEAVHIYIKRCLLYEKRGVPEDWDAIEIISTK
jgi:class 3 adenylate cyclase